MALGTFGDLAPRRARDELGGEIDKPAELELLVDFSEAQNPPAAVEAQEVRGVIKLRPYQLAAIERARMPEGTVTANASPYYFGLFDVARGEGQWDDVWVRERTDPALPLGFNALYDAKLLRLWTVSYGATTEVAASYGPGDDEHHRGAVIAQYRSRGRLDDDAGVQLRTDNPAT